MPPGSGVMSDRYVSIFLSCEPARAVDTAPTAWHIALRICSFAFGNYIRCHQVSCDTATTLAKGSSVGPVHVQGYVQGAPPRNTPPLSTAPVSQG